MLGIPEAIGITAAILIILAVAVIIVLVFLWRRFGQRKLKRVDTDGLYSKCQRPGDKQMQPWSLTAESTNLYDEIQPSPSTGQTDDVVVTESINSKPTQNTHKSYPGVDREEIKFTNRSPSMQGPDTHEYAVVNIEPKKGSVNAEEMSMSSPLCTGVEELYTAVMKKPESKAAENEEEALPVPPHTIEQRLYTAVQKKPKDNTVQDEASPPIPPYTGEELYTAA